MVFSTSRIHCQSTTFTLLKFFRVVCCQVSGYDLPILATVCTAMNELATKIDNILIEWISVHSCIPVESELYITFRIGRAHSFLISRFPIIYPCISLLRCGNTVPRISRIREYIKAISEGNFLPIMVSNSLRFPDIRRTSP